MKHVATLAVSVIALSLAACGKQEQPAAEATATAEAPGDIAGAPAAAPGQAFADAAASSDMFEIESSRLAAEKSATAKVKSFAASMIKAHTESTAKLKTAAGAATPPITPTPQLTPAQQQVLDDLKAKSGAEFDTAYAEAQVDSHQAALDALKSYSTTGDVPSLKSFATELVPTVTAHLNMAKGL